jgi:hypothetical protein
MTTEQLMVLLKDKYCAPEYAFLPQVRNQTGYSRQVRTADALALSLYPSRGLFMHGFEVKVSRSDWFNDLKNPEKADEIAKYCDYWWLVVSDLKVCKLEELPPTWGLLVAQNEKLYVAKQALKIESVPITKTMLCGIMRKASDESSQLVPLAQVNELAKIKADEIIKSEKYRAKYRIEDCEKIEAAVKQFEELSGIKIDKYGNYGLEDTAAAIRVIREQKSGQYLRRATMLREYAADVVKSVDELLADT